MDSARQHRTGLVSMNTDHFQTENPANVNISSASWQCDQLTGMPQLVLIPAPVITITFFDFPSASAICCSSRSAHGPTSMVGMMADCYKTNKTLLSSWVSVDNAWLAFKPPARLCCCFPVTKLSKLDLSSQTRYPEESAYPFTAILCGRNDSRSCRVPTLLPDNNPTGCSFLAHGVFTQWRSGQEKKKSYPKAPWTILLCCLRALDASVPAIVASPPYEL